MEVSLTHTGTLRLTPSVIWTPSTAATQRSRTTRTLSQTHLLVAPQRPLVAPPRIRTSTSWWHIQTVSVLWIRCIQKSARTRTQTTTATRPGHQKSFLPSPRITCTTLKTALCTGVPLLASPLSEPSPLPNAPERPLRAQRAPASAPRFSPALTPCLPSLLPSTIQTSTLLYRPGRPPYPQNSSRLLRSHAWRVRFLSLFSLPTSYTLSLCLHACLSVFLTVCFCLCSLLWIRWPSHFCHFSNRGDLQIWKNWVTEAVLCIRRQLPAGHLIRLIYAVLSNLQRAFRRVTAVPVRGCPESLSSLSLSLSSSICLSLCRPCLVCLPVVFVFFFGFARCVEMDTCISCQAQPKQLVDDVVI